MKRTFATILSLSAVALANGAVCPCFTAEQFEAIVASHKRVGCTYTTDPDDPEVTSMAVAYLWDGKTPVGVIQAGVTTELIEGKLVLGGLCGAGSKTDLPVTRDDVKDYADGEYDPAEFQACVNIMQAKCKKMCPTLVDLPDQAVGCGKLPF